MICVCYCGAEAGTEHDELCPHPLYEGTRDEVMSWTARYRENLNGAIAWKMIEQGVFEEEWRRYEEDR